MTVGELEVDEHDLRADERGSTDALGDRPRLGDRDRLAHDLDVGQGREDGREAGADEGLVVDEDEPDTPDSASIGYAVAESLDAKRSKPKCSMASMDTMRSTGEWNCSQPSSRTSNVRSELALASSRLQ